jgi:hypothetical protein
MSLGKDGKTRMKIIPNELIKSLGRPPDDFDCVPRNYQVRKFAEILLEHGALSLTPKDISELFIAADMTSPRRPSRKIRCGPAEVSTHLDAWIAKGKLPLSKKSGDRYILIEA